MPMTAPSVPAAQAVRRSLPVVLAAGCVIGACGNETFSINATLTINGQPAVITGSLNHFSTMILGSCVTYFATISGHLQVPAS